MDISILKIIGLATLAILAVLGIALFAKEEFDLRRGSGATVLEAVLQTLISCGGKGVACTQIAKL